MADNLLEKASILLTPTAYNDGSMLSVKPNENLYSSELATNGTFDTDVSSWTLSYVTADRDTSIFSNGGVKLTVGNTNPFSDKTFIKQSITGLTIGKIYRLSADLYTPSTNTDNNVATIGIVESSFNSTDSISTDSTDTIQSKSLNFTASSTSQAIYLSVVKSDYSVYGQSGNLGYFDNVSVKEDLSGDFTFSRGSAATRVNAQGLVEEITDTDLPRIDYTDGCGSWLLEPQSTNLYLNSDTLVTQSNATSASTYTVSFYGTGTITFTGTHTGTLVGTGANDRVSATFTTTSGTLTSTISGTCEKGQLEQLSYATSYIPTNGAISTRLQDIATNSGNSTLINSTEGVLYAEIAALANDGTNRAIGLSDGTSSNRFFIYYGTSVDFIALRMDLGGVQQFNLLHYISIVDNLKIAFKYKENDFALWINGVEVVTDNSTSAFSSGTLTRLGFDSGAGSSPFYGKCKALAVFKEALTDEQLQSLTTI